jgi:hypothetical protein
MGFEDIESETNISERFSCKALGELVPRRPSLKQNQCQFQRAWYDDAAMDYQTSKPLKYCHNKQEKTTK